MELQKNRTHLLITVVTLILIAISLVFSILQIAGASPDFPAILSAVFEIVTLIIGAGYIIAGFGKKQAWILRLFGISYALLRIVNLLQLCGGTLPVSLILAVDASIIIIFVLLLSKDLGREKTLILNALLLLANQFEFIVLIVISDGSFRFWAIITHFILSCLYGVMNCAKYIDKDSRGTN